MAVASWEGVLTRKSWDWHRPRIRESRVDLFRPLRPDIVGGGLEGVVLDVRFVGEFLGSG